MTIQENVRDFIEQLVCLGDGYKFSEDGYLLKASDETVLKFSKPDGTVAPAAVYDPINIKPDTIVINPFVEGLSNSQISQWFYETRTLALSGIIYRIMEGIITKALMCKDSKMDDSNLNSAEITILQPYLVGEYEVDVKMEKELKGLFQEVTDRNFFNIQYIRKTNSCVVNAVLCDPERLETLLGKKLRKRSAPIFTKMYLDILGVSDISELKTPADIQGCAKFNAYIKVYARILKRLKKFWSFQKKEFDFDRFFAHVDSFHEYFNTAKMVVNVPSSTTAIQQQAPWGDQQGMLPIGAQSNMNQMMPVSHPAAGMVNNMIPVNSMPLNNMTPMTPVSPMVPVGCNTNMGQMMQVPSLPIMNTPMANMPHHMGGIQAINNMTPVGMPIGAPVDVSVPVMTPVSTASSGGSNVAPFFK